MGIVGRYGGAALIATAVLALALAVDAWLAALIVCAALFFVAGTLALLGKNQVSQGTPPIPTEALESVKKDVQAVKGGNSSHERSEHNLPR